MPDEGARRLAAMDLDRLFTSPLTRRAAEYVRDHAASLAGDLPGEDPELATLVAELVLRADAVEPSGATLDLEALQLELADSDRRIAAARAQGDAVHDLAAERQRIRDAIRHRAH
jgi:hypothetical protein